MFTGIVQTAAPVKQLITRPGLASFALELPTNLVKGLKVGASVAVNGTCLTVTKTDGRFVWFDAMDETLTKTTIGDIQEGSMVNVERSAKMGDEIGGHVMSGHIIGKAVIIKKHIPKENNVVLTFQVPKAWMKYILDKGFIGLNGCSLTVVDPDHEEHTFDVWLIPETLGVTTFGELKEGDEVNVEIDSRTQAIVDTVQQVLKKHNK